MFAAHSTQLRKAVPEMELPLRSHNRASGIGSRDVIRTAHSHASAPPVSMLELSRTFNDLKAVDGISLGVSAGSILGIIGPSGPGR